MNYTYLEEPLLEFGEDTHICPRAGIADFSVYDSKNHPRRNDIYIGAIGTNPNFDLFNAWLKKISTQIPAKSSDKPNLFPPFIGFNKYSGYKKDFVLSDTNIKPILSKEISKIINIKQSIERIEAAVKLYAEKIKFLAQNKTPEVIVCIIPDKLYDVIHSQRITADEQAEDHLESKVETNFRRMLKAKTMRYSNIPIQYSVN
jgi:hypothetical protein